MLRPLRFLGSSWPWRSAAYLVSGVVVGAVTIVLFFTIGLLLLPLVPLSGIAAGRVERWRMRLVDVEPTPNPHQPMKPSGRWAWMRARLGEVATWRELGYLMIS